MDRIRFGGLASGFDTQSIVENLMRAERLPLDKIKQQKQTMQWKLEDYRSINTQLSTFRDSLLKMRLQSTFTSKTVASSDESKVTATANSSSGNASYTINQVTALATSASNSSSSSILAAGQKLDPAKGIYGQKDALSGFTWNSTSAGVTDTFTAKTGGSSFKLSTLSAGEKITEVTSITAGADTFNVVTDPEATLAANEARVLQDGTIQFGKAITAGSVVSTEYKSVQNDTISTSAATKSLQLRQSGFEAAGADVVTKSYTVGANGQKTYGPEKTWTYSANAPDSLGANEYTVTDDGKIHFGTQLAANTELNAEYSKSYLAGTITSHRESGAVTQSFKFNGNTTMNQMVAQVNGADIGVNMFYDDFQGKVSVSRTETGQFNDSGNEMEFSGMFQDSFNLDGAEAGGTNAQFTINGLVTERASNTFTLNGTTFTLKKTFSDGAVTTTPSNNTDEAIKNIRTFVDDYNKLIDEMNGKLREEVNRDYKPLTDEQRESLSEKEIEKWEEEARKGNLRNDQYLRSAIDGMRSKFYESVDTGGAFSNLTQIGITTSRNYMDGGKLEINEDKLREALETDADSVYQLFAADGEGNRGIARTIGDTVSTTITRITDHAGNGIRTNQSFTLGRNLDDIDSRISNFERRLQSTEDRYWKQFAAFEKAMQQQNDQLSYMLSQLGMNQQQ